MKLLQNIPEALNSFVGQENAKRGILKVFHALQDKRLNKHLVYVSNKYYNCIGKPVYPNRNIQTAPENLIK